MEGAQAGQTSLTGQTGQTSQVGQTSGQTEQTGVQVSYNLSVTAGSHGVPSGIAAHPGIYHGAFVYNRAIPYYVPPVNYNSHVISRHKEFLDARGLSRVRK